MNSTTIKNKLDADEIIALAIINTLAKRAIGDFKKQISAVADPEYTEDYNNVFDMVNLVAGIVTLTSNAFHDNQNALTVENVQRALDNLEYKNQ